MRVAEKMEVSREVIDNLLTLTGNIIGENAVKIIVSSINFENPENGKQIVYKIAEEIEKIYGLNGGYAIFRQIGREVAKRMMDNHPEDEWKYLMEVGLNTMGFAEGIKNLEGGACICNCVFYPSFLEPKGIEPIKHTICWGGLGFIEGFARKLEPDVVEVIWKERDYENKRCIFEYVRGENGKG